MIHMAVYGSILATTTNAASVALEQQAGWTRTLRLTRLSPAAYVVTKAAVAMSVAALPLILLSVVGVITGAHAPIATWIGSVVLGWARLGGVRRVRSGHGQWTAIGGGDAGLRRCAHGSGLRGQRLRTPEGRHAHRLAVHADVRRQRPRQPPDDGWGDPYGDHISLWVAIANVVVWAAIMAGAAAFSSVGAHRPPVTGPTVAPMTETTTTGRRVRWWSFAADAPDRSWAFTAVWLVFLGYPIASLLRSHAGALRVVWGLTLIGIFAVVYVLAARRVLSAGRTAGRVGARLRGGVVLIAAAASPVLADGVVSFTPYLMGIAAFGFGGVLGPVLVGLVLVVGLGLPLVVPGWSLDSGTVLALVIVAFVMVLMISARAAEQRRDEAEARQREADERLAVVAERERVARDVHDILGHSLTVMTVKTELAGRLVDIDPERAKAELAELHSLSRQALQEVRSTVGSLRTPDLRTELASARTALSAAEVDLEVDGSVDDIAPPRRELFAWVIRESVTNVVPTAVRSSVGSSSGRTGSSCRTTAPASPNTPSERAARSHRTGRGSRCALARLRWCRDDGGGGVRWVSPSDCSLPTIRRWSAERWRHCSNSSRTSRGRAGGQGVMRWSALRVRTTSTSVCSTSRCPAPTASRRPPPSGTRCRALGPSS